MLKSITLQNFKSFGLGQSVPLEPITILVGPNNSGKSNFLSVGKFVREVAGEAAGNAYRFDPFVFHRPAVGAGNLVLEWAGDGGAYHATVESSGSSVDERLHPAGVANWTSRAGLINPFGWASNAPQPFLALRLIAQQVHGRVPDYTAVIAPLLRSHDVKLSLDALRADSTLADAPLGVDGSNLAAVVNRWRSGDPERSEEFEAVIRSYLPEIRRVLAPAKQNGTGTTFRLEFEHEGGQKFDAEHVSDGVLFFAALVAHVIDAGEGALILLEEPENSIHPRRLHEVVELFRRLAVDKKCQFVIATHAPALLDEFRDEPDAILLFRRGPEGTVVRPLSKVESLLEALAKSKPGEMLASGFFNDGF